MGYRRRRYRGKRRVRRRRVTRYARRRPVRSGTKRRFNGRRRLRGVSSHGTGGLYARSIALGAGAAYNAFIAGGPATTRQPTIRDKGGYTQWDRYSAASKLGRLTQRKLNAVNADSLVYVWRLAQRLTGNGYLFMNNYYDAAGPTHGIPAYFWELTANGGTACHTLQRGATGYTWVIQSGKDATDALSNNWQVEKVLSNVGSTPIRNAVLKWAEARFDLWGAKNQPAHYNIQLVQVNDEDMVPGVNLTTAENIDVFDSYFKKLVFNPTIKDPSTTQSTPFKVLWSRKVLLNPTETSEADPDPHCRTVRFFWRMNRMCNFAWKQTDTTIATPADALTSTKFEPMTGSEVKTQVHPRARVYLMITCASWFTTVGAVGTQTTTNTPTINASVRVAYTY